MKAVFLACSFHLASACFTPTSCLQEGDNLLETHHGVKSPEDCQARCVSESSCQHFTHYNSSVVPGLATSCLLFTTCSSTNARCWGCTSGPRLCDRRCRVPGDGAGGLWVCPGNRTLVEDMEECFYTCGGHLTSTTCLSGQCTLQNLYVTKVQA